MNAKTSEQPQEPQLLTAILEDSVALSERTKGLTFSVQDVDSFGFTPGQFISVREPRAGGKMTTRAYSIASAPRGDARFELCVNRVDEGFMSNYLCDLPVGAKVHFHGPYGQLTLDAEAKNCVFVATGTGVAPFRGMAQWLFEDKDEVTAKLRNDGMECWLLFGARSEDDLLYRAEFEEIAQKFPNFHYLTTLSRADDGWQGRRGHVQEMLRELATGRDDLKAYLCGRGEMVKETRKLLKEEMLWDKSRIAAERYD